MFIFQGRKGAARYVLCYANVSFTQGKSRARMDDPMTIRVK